VTSFPVTARRPLGIPDAERGAWTESDWTPRTGGYWPHCSRRWTGRWGSATTGRSLALRTRTFRTLRREQIAGGVLRVDPERGGEPKQRVHLDLLHPGVFQHARGGVPVRRGAREPSRHAARRSRLYHPSPQGARPWLTRRQTR
jgi:hypothetical protein